MAGAGGGGRGGGGGRSRGGSRGGFHGGGYRHSHHPGHGWHFHGGFGGGCLSRLIVLIFVLVCFAIDLLAPLFGGTGRYDENRYQDYANARYEEAFGDSSAYEDNLLVSVLVDDDYYSYYYIAWVGDHVVTDINHMLGARGTVLGDAMEQCINSSSYKYSLDSNLAQVMEILTEEVEALGLAGSFSCSENRGNVSAQLVNDSELELTESTITNALTAFASATGIPTVMVVEDMDDVFGGSLAPGGIILVAAVVLIAIVAGVVLVLRRRKQQAHPYHTFDDQY